jgi:hypothetical protein
MDDQAKAAEATSPPANVKGSRRRTGLLLLGLSFTLLAVMILAEAFVIRRKEFDLPQILIVLFAGFLGIRSLLDWAGMWRASLVAVLIFGVLLLGFGTAALVFASQSFWLPLIALVLGGCSIAVAARDLRRGKPS